MDKQTALIIYDGSDRFEAISKIRNEAEIEIIKLGFNFINPTYHYGINLDRRGDFALQRLAETIRVMSFCQNVFFCKGWETSLYCVTVHNIALWNNLSIIYQ